MNQDSHHDDRQADRELAPYRGDLRLAEVQQFHSQADEFAEASEPGEGRGMVTEYVRTILRQRWLIGGFALGGLVLAIGLQIATQPVYQARTSLEVQAMNTDLSETHNTVGTAAALPGDVMLQTQVKLLASESLADRVKLKLQEDPHSNQVAESDLLSKIGTSLGLKHGIGTIPYDKLLAETADSIKVKPIGVSQLIEVTCDSWDAAFAALYCNTMTSEFQISDLESRGTQAKHISDFLVRQASDVHLRADEAQKHLEKAAGGNGILIRDHADTIGEDRLKQMQNELVRAQADRMEKQAELSEAQSGPQDAIPDSTAFAASKARVADLEGQIASLIPPLTEANPKIIHLRAQIGELQANMQREKSVTQSKLQSSFQAAKHREDLLQKSYENMQNGVSTDMQKSSEIEILRREVQSEQQLYQTLIQRAKEAGFASAMPASTIRIVDEAHLPHIPVYPRRLTAAAVGTFLGLAIGLLLAFLIERQVPRLRAPGDISRLVHLPELGVIPSASANARFSSRMVTPARSAVLRLNDTSSSTNHADDTWIDEALVAEAYRSTSLSLLLNERDKRSRVFVVSSPNPGEGKTTVTSNLGIALSKSRLRVVIVDGDLRKSRLHDLLDVDNTLGLRNLLSEGVETYEHRMELVCKPTAYENLSVIPSGNGDEPVADLLHSPQLGILMKNLAAHYDVVLVDSPPMLHITDARILAGNAHSVILVFRSSDTKLANAVAVRNMLERDRVRVAGSILNNFDPRREGLMQYYNGYQEYAGAVSEAKAS